MYTAQLCGIDQVTVGGVQAIAAMTFGTRVSPMYLNFLVQATNMSQSLNNGQHGLMWPLICRQGQVNFLVAADATAKPSYVAADLLSQAEHGPDSQVILVTTDASILPKVQRKSLSNWPIYRGNQLLKKPLPILK